MLPKVGQKFVVPRPQKPFVITVTNVTAQAVIGRDAAGRKWRVPLTWLAMAGGKRRPDRRRRGQRMRHSSGEDAGRRQRKAPVDRGIISFPSKSIGSIQYEGLGSIADAARVASGIGHSAAVNLSPKRIHRVVDSAVAHMVKVLKWKPAKLRIRFHNRGTRMGLAWSMAKDRRKRLLSAANVRPRVRTIAENRLISIHAKVLLADDATFRQTMLHELNHHYTEEHRVGPRASAHDLIFCINLRRLDDLIKNAKVYRYYFPNSQIKHLRGQPGAFTRFIRRNPSGSQSALAALNKIKFAPLPAGGIKS